MQFKSFFLVAIVLLVSSSVFAQDTAISVETNLVTLNVGVTDRNGIFVKGLTKDDFMLAEGGTDRKIDVFSANDAALSIGIVYDMHALNDQTTNVLEALKRFTGRLEPHDDYFITVFNEKGSVTTDFVPDADQLRSHLSSPASGALARFTTRSSGREDERKGLRMQKNI